MSNTSLFRIEETADEGRSMIAEVALERGSLVLTDHLFVSATWEEENCIECDEEHDFETCSKVIALYPSAVIKKLPEVLEVLDILNQESKTEVLDGLDRQRVFIKCLCMVHRYNAEVKKKKKKAPKKKAASENTENKDAVGEKGDSVPPPLAPLFNLRPSNKEQCLEFVKVLKKNKLLNACSLIPHNLSDENTAILIGILNSNSHEVEKGENGGGSGIFLNASMMNHSCRPNCNFSVDEKTCVLSVYTIRQVEKNEHLTIDYNDECYLPTRQRREMLKRSYGFICKCEGCTREPEYCRAFVCSDCQGLLLPEHTGSWKCTACKKEASVEAKQRMLAAEQEAENEPPTSLQDITSLIGKRILHEQHYIMFFVMQEFAREMAGSSDMVDCRVAQDLWIKISACLQRVLPPYHHSKVLCFDMLGQVKLKIGDRSGATAAFTQAHEISRVINGPTNATTTQLKSLSENTPRTVQELQSFYRTVK